MNAAAAATAATRRRLAAAVPGLCVFLVAVYPWINLIVYHGYPWARVETWSYPVAAAVIAAIAGRWSEMHRPGPRAVVLAILLTLALTVQLNLPPVVILLVLGGSVAFGLIIRGQLVPVLTAVMAVAGGAALVRSPEGPPGSRDVQPASALPPVLYLVFDGHQGLAGIPPHEPEGYVESTVARTYLEAGFTLYTGAYSRHPATLDSLFNVLNLQAEPTYRFETAKNDPEARQIVPNRLFEDLAKAGYAFHVTQTVEADLCAGIPPDRLGSCRTQRIPFLASLADSDLHTAARAVRMVKTLAFQSRVIQRLADRLGVVTDLDVTYFDIDDFQSFAQRVFSAGPGWVHVGHFLIPHAPYLYQADCSRRRVGALWTRLTVTGIPGLPANWPLTRSERYARYLPQLLCVNRLMDGLLSALDDAGILDRVHIIVHGDHGSRITERSAHPYYRATLTEQDVLDIFSVLFAYRAAGPGAAARVDEPVPAEEAMARAARAILGRAPEGEGTAAGDPFVYLAAGSRVERLPLDGFAPRPGVGTGADQSPEPEAASSR